MAADEMDDEPAAGVFAEKAVMPQYPEQPAIFAPVRRALQVCGAYRPDG